MRFRYHSVRTLRRESGPTAADLRLSVFLEMLETMGFKASIDCGGREYHGGGRDVQASLG